MSKKVPYTLSENSITVFWEGKPYSVRSDNANFQGLRQALLMLDMMKSEISLILPRQLRTSLKARSKLRMRLFTTKVIVYMEL